MKSFRLPVLFTIFLTLSLFSCQPKGDKAPGSKYFSDWPEGASPEEVGKKLSENFLARKFHFQEGRFGRLVYPEVCAWYGALEVAHLTDDAALREKLIRHYDLFLTPEGSKYIVERAHVDYRVAGVVPLEIYIQTKDEKYLNDGIRWADAQWDEPTEDGITKEARYWVDDIYMISSLQVEAYRATGELKYLERAALTTATYLDKLQEPNGLFHHAEDSPFFWGRGNGWYAAGMAELLSELPEDNQYYDRVMSGYLTMMESLLKYQSEEGLWRQLVDKEESWLETSGTGMFAFAMVTGVKNGWLEADVYGPAARKAWLALVSRIDEEGNVQDVCVGTNKAFKEVGPDLDKQLEFYIGRDRDTGDLHGQAPVLWTAMALLK
ncbi:glycoside hydrolase family 88/105 protein [Maribellus sediminis]|uniref:glycoside hydrolase family 88/105 protein n=1 Tax=Maribellus sediminis TaxID=2696285 RepID=UPI0014320387|nr:glycoside hydrolase family 88 protein [Maribellus sediminis]